MNQKTVALENADLTARLFGSFDINVRMLERAFDVSIQNREGGENDAVTVKGEDAEAVRMAADAIQYLKTMARYNEMLTEQQVKYVVDMVRAGREEELRGLEQECICITTRGNPLRPRRLGRDGMCRRSRRIRLCLASVLQERVRPSLPWRWRCARCAKSRLAASS